MTRQEYLAGKYTHHEYYAQFVDASIRKLVLDRFGLKAIVVHYKADIGGRGHILLAKWGNLALSVPGITICKVRDIGQDKYPDSLCTRVCILKTAAKQIAAEHIASQIKGNEG